MHVVGHAVLIFSLAYALCASAAAQAESPSPEALACAEASTQGQVERDRGHLLMARGQFRECAQPDCPSVVAKSCTEWLIELDRRIPSVVIRVSGGSAHDLTHAAVRLDKVAVALDGRPVELDPGTHDITASAPSWLESTQTILLTEGEQRRLIVLQLQPAPAPAPAAIASPHAAEPTSYRVPDGSWILGGVGILGLASFAVLRVEAGRELDHLRETCAPDCPRELSEPGKRYATAADVSLGIGAAALAGASAWALIHWFGDESATTTIACMPTRTGLVASLSVRY